MRERLSEWAPYLGALGVAVLVIAGLLRLVNENIEPSYLLGLGALGVVLIALFVINRRGEVRGALTGRTAIYGSNVLVMSLAFIGIVGVLTWLILRSSWHTRWDLTAGKSRTLSELTVNILKKELTEPVQILGFFTNRPDSTSRQTADDLRKLVIDYKLYTDKLTYRAIDPDVDPQLAIAYEIVQDGTIVVERGSGANARREKIYSADENSVTNALLKVLKTQQRVFYFTTGHGERGLEDSGANGLAFAGIYLDQYNYKRAALNLATTVAGAPVSGTVTVGGQLPLDTSAVIIVGPQKPFPPEEAARIKDYLDKGGRVVIFTAIGVDDGLKDLYAAYGVEVKNDRVLDPGQSYNGNQAIPVILQFPSHPLTTQLDQYGLLLPGARAVSAVKNPPAGRTPVELFKTTARSCDKDYEATKNPTQTLTCDANADPKGPFSLGVVVEASNNPNDANVKSRLVVIGSSEILGNQIMQSQVSGGIQLFWQNLINWLVGEENLIAIPPKQTNNATIGILTGLDQSLVLWSNILLLPGAIILIGAIIWWRRR